MDLISKLPYGKDFLFVDKISEVSEKHILGSYFFSENLGFYAAHFKDKPVTPGVILTECAAQIGLACLGLYLIGDPNTQKHRHFIALTETQIDFFKPVYPNETVWVKANLVYFRFNKMKVNIEIRLANQQLIAKGTLAGMLTKTKNNNAE